FKAAFSSALSSLSDDERNVLNLHFIEGLSVDAIATVYDVSGMTIRRWIRRARDHILEAVYQLLAGQLRLKPEELPSLVALLQSQLDLSIRRYLQKHE